MKFNKKTSNFYIAALITGTIGLSGCSKVQKELGIGRHSPDEFTVIKRAPLSLPPEYDLLPPDPDRQNTSNATKDVASKAQSVIFSQNDAEDTAEKNQTPETSLLNRIGTSKADPNIRKTLDRETGYVVLDEEKTMARKIMFWKNDEKDTSIIDATKENERLEENDKAGLPINTGDVPTIEKKQSTIDKLF